MAYSLMCAPPASTSVSNEATATVIRLASFTEHLLLSLLSAGDLPPRPPSPMSLLRPPLGGYRRHYRGITEADTSPPAGYVKGSTETKNTAEVLLPAVPAEIRWEAVPGVAPALREESRRGEASTFRGVRRLSDDRYARRSRSARSKRPGLLPPCVGGCRSSR
jgi:hypothetical protein